MVAETTARSVDRVLVVDDDPSALRFFERFLKMQNYEVVTATDGLQAREFLAQQGFDVVLSDISMPGLNGIQLLQTARERDLDVSVVLATGEPRLDTAMQAVEHGALRYLTKPVDTETLREVIAYAARVAHVARARREMLSDTQRRTALLADKAGLQAAFGRALGSIWMAYQPIVRHSRREVLAYEALLRSNEPSLPSPLAILDAAERLERLYDLGRAIRTLVAERLAHKASPETVFVNLHPSDLHDEALFAGTDALARYAHRVVLEITERASMESITDLSQRLTYLRDMGYRIALDDLGSGYASLNSFLQLSPDIVKIDMELVRDVHSSDKKQKLVTAVVQLCHGLKIDVVAEGVETRDEGIWLVGNGVDLLQGYFFGRPSAEFESVPEAAFT